MKILPWLEQHEPGVRLAFRSLVIIILVAIAFRVEEAVDWSYNAHARASEANDNAASADKSIDHAISLAAQCSKWAEQAADSARSCDKLNR